MNWQIYFAVAGVVKTYAAASRPRLDGISFSLELQQNNLQARVWVYLLVMSIASSMLVTAWTAKQHPFCFLPMEDDSPLLSLEHRHKQHSRMGSLPVLNIQHEAAFPDRYDTCGLRLCNLV